MDEGVRFELRFHAASVEAGLPAALLLDSTTLPLVIGERRSLWRALGSVDHFCDGTTGRQPPQELSQGVPYASKLVPSKTSPPSKGISRRHASIVAADCNTDDFVAHIIDHNSANGVAVNGVRIKPNQPHPLRVNDEVVLGIPLVDKVPVGGKMCIALPMKSVVCTVGVRFDASINSAGELLGHSASMDINEGLGSTDKESEGQQQIKLEGQISRQEANHGADKVQERNVGTDEHRAMEVAQKDDVPDGAVRKESSASLSDGQSEGQLGTEAAVAEEEMVVEERTKRPIEVVDLVDDDDDEEEEEAVGQEQNKRNVRSRHEGEVDREVDAPSPAPCPSPPQAQAQGGGPALLELLRCPVCFEPVCAAAHLVPCGHVLCFTCAQRRFHHQMGEKVGGSTFRCPVDRKEVAGVTRDMKLDELVDAFRSSGGPPNDEMDEPAWSTRRHEGLALARYYEQVLTGDVKKLRSTEKTLLAVITPQGTGEAAAAASNGGGRGGGKGSCEECGQDFRSGLQGRVRWDCSGGAEDLRLQQHKRGGHVHITCVRDAVCSAARASLAAHEMLSLSFLINPDASTAWATQLVKNALSSHKASYPWWVVGEVLVEDLSPVIGDGGGGGGGGDMRSLHTSRGGGARGGAAPSSSSSASSTRAMPPPPPPPPAPAPQLRLVLHPRPPPSDPLVESQDEGYFRYGSDSFEFA